MIRPLLIAMLLGTMTVPVFSQATTSPAEKRNQSLQFFRRLLVEDYDRYGRRDAKWDADARAVLEALARILAWDFRPDGDEFDEISSRAGRLRENHCTDPAVLFATARTYQFFNRRYEDYAPIYTEAAKRIEETGYHPLLKCTIGFTGAMVRARDRTDTTLSRREARRMVTASMESLSRLLNDPAVTVEQILDIYDQIGDASRFVERDRAIVVERALPLLEQSERFKPLLPIARAKFLYVYSLDAQRTTPATAETTEQAKQRLADAIKTGEQAWAKNPSNVHVAVAMMRISAASDQLRSSLPSWFERARTLEPLDYAVHAAYLSCLEPQWQGNIKAMIAFGRECLRKGDWESGIPMLLVEAHIRAASYDTQGQPRELSPDYFTTDPQIWQDVRAVYETFLKSNPDSLYHRSRFAQIACWCKEWDAAREQFTAMGDSFSLSWFRSRQNYETYRNQSIRRGQ